LSEKFSVHKFVQDYLLQDITVHHYGLLYGSPAIKIINAMKLLYTSDFRAYVDRGLSDSIWHGPKGGSIPTQYPVCYNQAYI